ncbi:NUDIX hydrolase [Pseudoalteromonas sp. SSDWG2]|uniref:NUDIX hydrolase n=1 Tax=Pseudoalteromonas sp. SSDWG2 TaxID=3139391 RepID=UPI003BA887F7
MHKPNVTVAIVLKCNERYLLVEERDKYSQKIVFNQPAGHLEHGETIIQACIRELQEETGLSAQLLGLVGIYSLHAANGKHYLRFCFYGELDTELHTTPHDDDIIACHWLTLDEIKQKPLRSELVLQCIEDSLSRPLISLDYLRS